MFTEVEVPVLRTWILAFAGLSEVATAQAKASANACTMSAEETAWIESSLKASAFVRTERLHISTVSHPTIILFNANCRFEGKAGEKTRWTATAHAGKIRLPGGDDMPAAVTSFTSSDDKSGDVFFVMALPSVWQAAKITSGTQDIGLKGVFLHEFMHVTQAPILKPAFQDAAAHFTAPQDLNDDALQVHFKADPAYVAVWEKERDLLFKAVHEPDSIKAKDLAREAYTLMKARQDRWFTSADALWKPYDDIFLTMEGVGQWTAYAWLSDPKGGAMSQLDAENKMRGGRRWWSQDEGFGLFLVIDRFVPNWASKAFSDHPMLGIDLLREAVGAKTVN